MQKLPHYREYVVHLLPGLTMLDYQRVRPREREAAAKLFGGEAGAAKLAEVVKRTVFQSDTERGEGAAESGAPMSMEVGDQSSGPSAEERARIEQAIAQATSLEEVNALEAKLKAGDWGSGS